MSKPEATMVKKTLGRSEKETSRGTKLKREPCSHLGDTRECQNVQLGNKEMNFCLKLNENFDLGIYPTQKGALRN